MTEDRDALIAHYHRSRELMLAAIEGLSDEQMTERSLDGWSVKDHLAHLAFWDDLRAGELERLSAGYASAWRLTTEEDQAVNDVVTRARKDLSLEQVHWEVEASRARVLEALRQATPEALDPSRYGEAGLVSGHEEQHAGWISRWRTERGI